MDKKINMCRVEEALSTTEEEWDKKTIDEKWDIVNLRFWSPILTLFHESGAIVDCEGDKDK